MLLSRLAGALVIIVLTAAGVAFVTNWEKPPSHHGGRHPAAPLGAQTEQVLSLADPSRPPSAGGVASQLDNSSGRVAKTESEPASGTLAGKSARGEPSSGGPGNGNREDKPGKSDKGNKARGRGTTSTTGAGSTSTTTQATSTTTGSASSTSVSDSSTTSTLVSSTTSLMLDGVSIEPGVSIQALVNSHPSETVFVLKTGTHMNQKVVPKDGMMFVGEPGAVMDGGNRTDAAFSNGGSNVTIQGLIIQNYDTPAQRGAIEAAGAGWKIIGNEIRYNAGAGLSLGGDGFIVDGNHIHHNEQIGIIGQNARGARVVNNQIAHNNHHDRYDYGWESGGTKFLRTTNLYVANNNVHHNHGPGLWTDYNNYNTIYEKNTVRDNYGPGIFHEVSYDATIRNNTVTGNAQRFYIGGILIASSPNVEVHGNTVTGNHGGIVGLQDDRGSGSRGTFQTTGLNVHHNNVAWNNGFHGVQVNAGPDITQTNTITYDHNNYNTNQNQPFKWGASSTSMISWQQWRNKGHDPNSSLR